MNQAYLETARLLTRVAPLVLVDDTFALKGGTAINVFTRDMPRLSVDLDLVFPDHTVPRAPALKHISEHIQQSATCGTPAEVQQEKVRRTNRCSCPPVIMNRRFYVRSC